MFDSLAEKLQATLSEVRQRGTLTEQDIDRALREIRLALLEADVNFKVVRQFTADVKERCLGAAIVGSLNPGQQVVKIVAEQLTELMGGEGKEPTLRFAASPPTVILLAGLQGSGKTTAAAKLARSPARAPRLLGGARRLRHLPPGGGGAARQDGRPRGRGGVRARHRARPRGDRDVGAGACAGGGQGCADRRHQRAPARRRGADGGARAHPRGRQAPATRCSWWMR